MKLIFVIFALCLAAVNGVDLTELQSTISDFLSQMAKISRDSSHVLKYQLKQIVYDRLEKVEADIEDIAILRGSNEICDEDETERIMRVVSIMHKVLNDCSAEAAHSSAKLMTDIISANQQLIFEGELLLRLHRKCSNYENIDLRKSCFSRLSTKVTMYSTNAHNSIKTIQQANKHRIPGVFAVAKSCANDAIDTATMKLDTIRDSIKKAMIN